MEPPAIVVVVVVSNQKGHIACHHSFRAATQLVCSTWNTQF